MPNSKVLEITNIHLLNKQTNTNKQNKTKQNKNNKVYF